jgi:hypothetical protein
MDNVRHERHTLEAKATRLDEGEKFLSTVDDDDADIDSVSSPSQSREESSCQD